MRYQISDKKPLAGSEALREAAETELRVLLCLYEMRSAEPEALAEAAGCSLGEAKDALAFWRGAGVVARCASGAAEKPAKEAFKEAKDAGKATPSAEKAKPVQRSQEVTYTTGELAEKLERYQLRSLFTACQQAVGKECGRVEMNTLVYLYEQLGLSGDYILMLLSYCIELGKPSFRYMEKVALGLEEQEIKTVEALERYIEAQRQYRSAEGKLRRMFGLGDRAPSSRERGYFDKWVNQFGYGEEIVGIAYDITVNHTGKAAMAYADKLLSDWHLAGCKTPEAVEAHLRRAEAQRGGGEKPQKKQAAMSFDVEDAFQKALARSYGEKK